MAPAVGATYKITLSKYRYLRNSCMSFVFLLTETCVPESWLPEWPRGGHLGGCFGWWSSLGCAGHLTGILGVL